MPSPNDRPSVSTSMVLALALVLLVTLTYSFVIGHPLLGLLGVAVAGFAAVTLYLLYRMVLAVERLADVR